MGNLPAMSWLIWLKQLIIGRGRTILGNKELMIGFKLEKLGAFDRSVKPQSSAVPSKTFS